jgi:hypothetical protein
VTTSNPTPGWFSKKASHDRKEERRKINNSIETEIVNKCRGETEEKRNFSPTHPYIFHSKHCFFTNILNTIATPLLSFMPPAVSLLKFLL